MEASKQESNSSFEEESETDGSDCKIWKILIKLRRQGKVVPKTEVNLLLNQFSKSMW